MAALIMAGRTAPGSPHPVPYRSRMNPSLGRNFEAMDTWSGRRCRRVRSAGEEESLGSGKGGRLTCLEVEQPDHRVGPPARPTPERKPPSVGRPARVHLGEVPLRGRSPGGAWRGRSRTASPWSARARIGATSIARAGMSGGRHTESRRCWLISTAFLLGIWRQPGEWPNRRSCVPGRPTPARASRRRWRPAWSSRGPPRKPRWNGGIPHGPASAPDARAAPTRGATRPPEGILDVLSYPGALPARRPRAPLPIHARVGQEKYPRAR